jgi:thiol:disulfide interchange protein DsbD
MRLPKFLAATLLAGLFALHPPARAEEDLLGNLLPKEDAKPKSVATLVPEVKSIAPGKPFTVALSLDHPDNWHSYYRNSGGIEQSPTIEWKLPEGFSAAEPQWPVPHVIDGAFGKSFSYSGNPILLIEITPPAGLATGSPVSLSAQAKWQICDPKNCENEEASFTLSLPVETEAVIDETTATLFTTARAALPKPASGWGATAENSGGQITLRLKAPAGAAIPADLDFVPSQPFVGSLSSGGKITQEGDEWVLTLNRVKETVIGPVEQGNSFGGILQSREVIDPSQQAKAILIPETALARPAPKPLALSAFLPVLGGMLLGGLILNLMPCVFPVIGLKIMGFVQQAGQDRKKIVFHGLAFTAGVVISFWVLSGILFALRSAAGTGQEVSWGYQLQNPWTVLILMLLMFVLALSMYGVFEIGSSVTSVGGKLQTKEGVSGSFFSGILATVVATPCSAPFLGAAIGAAIALPAVQFFTAFTAMAIGLSLPYLILSIFPKLVDLLPRPGAWMESFKQAMAFLLFATAGYLLWVYVGQIEVDNMLNVVFGLTAVAIAAWIFGRWHTPFRSGGVKATALVLTLLFAAAGVKLAAPPEKSELVWETWDAARVEELMEEGTPVFVDFTAKWCATCQLNKKRAYPKEVAALMKERGMVLMRADKTNPNPAIDAKLEELGRAAIPVNVLYVPEKEPFITKELFDAGYMKDLITREVPLPEK